MCVCIYICVRVCVCVCVCVCVYKREREERMHCLHHCLTKDSGIIFFTEFLSESIHLKPQNKLPINFY